MRSGFWSYVHADDEADQGRIAQLARDVAAEFNMITGENVELFLDRDDIGWGDNWRSTIDENLAATAFFVAVVTPRFFGSPECRRESTTFAKKAQLLGVQELFLPLIYVDTPLIRDDQSTDELVRLVRTYQWEDWTSLRFAERTSEDYRRGVHRLAIRLRDADAAADATAGNSPLEGPDDDDIMPRLTNALQASNAALTRLLASNDSIASSITEIGSLFSASTREISAMTDPSKSSKDKAIRRLASDLNPVAERLYEETNRFLGVVHDVDYGFRTVIDLAPSYVTDDAQRRSQVCGFYDTVRRISHAADSGLGSARGTLETMAPLEQASRDLRSPLRRISDAFQRLLEARSLTFTWVQLIDESEVLCP